MPLKAVLLDFNGIVINDEEIHQQLIEQLLLAENIRPNCREITQVCLGRSDRACLAELLQRQGRLVTDEYLDQLIERKAQNYQALLTDLGALPLYPGLEDLIYKIRAAQLKLAVVSGACRRDIDWVLSQTSLQQTVAVIVSADDIAREASKPEPDSYLLGVKRLNQRFPELQLAPGECLAIEDSFAGIEAAKRAGVPVAGVAHTYPYQMIHRRATWVVDRLTELDFDWLRQFYNESLPAENRDSNSLVEL